MHISSFTSLALAPPHFGFTQIIVKRVLIIGGYGNFGGMIAHALAGEQNIRLLIAGRSRQKAEAFIQAMKAANAPEAWELDISGDIGAAFAMARPDIVIHTCGPYQHQNYAVAEAAITQGAHYIDLADGRAFVNGISRLDGAARTGGVLVVSGASSVPCLTAAVIDHYAKNFGTITDIAYGISAAQRTERGVATGAAILSYVGKPFTTLCDGIFRTVYGWQDLHAVHYPELGTRWFANCDVPDLDLLPARYPKLKTLRFYAGAEVAFLHIGLWSLSWLVRWGLLSSLQKWNPFLLKAAKRFDALGTPRSGFHMFLSGTGQDGKAKRKEFFIIARQGHGPFIPCVPAVLLSKALANGSLTQTGARACLDLIDLAAYRAALAHLDISFIS